MKRFLLLLLLPLCGCQIPGIDPPKAEHPFALTEKLVADQAAGNDELRKISTASAASDERLSRIEAGVTATNAHLADMVEHFRKTQGQDGDLLNALDKLRESVESATKKETPFRSAATVAAGLFPDDLLITVDGQQVAIGDFVRQWYKQPWRELSGTVDECLIRFGVAAEHLQRLTEEAKQLLHGAIHEHAESLKSKPQKAKSIERTIVKDGVERRVTRDESQMSSGPPPVALNQSSACPGGVCPMQPQQQQWTYQYSRRTRRR